MQRSTAICGTSRGARVAFASDPLTGSRGHADSSARSADSILSVTLTRKSLPGQFGTIGALRRAQFLSHPRAVSPLPIMRPTHRLAAIVLGALALVSCSTDAPTAVPHVQQSPPPQEASQDLLGLTTLLGVDGLQRTKALAVPITVSKSIGPEGGTLTIPEAGVTVTVPRGALAATTKITMTARAGTLVAYDFAPHGITFAKPLVFSQKLSGTNATLLGAPFLRLGYYADANLLTKTGGVVSELLGGVVNTLSWTFTSSIKHFSGYMVSCGRR
jgi:hypothetical protein